ncbi:tetratricopeptide repeat protein [Streptomyces sp. NPDC020807]|uniref:tetratricopeptide repeat protein n=1 Tax=Streptomyces sp. NPDC020807 TaxID=3155119 RepID=UPI0033E48819
MSAEASGERSVAAGRDIGWVHTGDRVTVLSAEAAGPVRCPDGIVNVPRKSAHFVGRADELDALEGADEPLVVAGLGGVGKSSLVARWALRQAGARNPVWWVAAESRADVDAGLAALAAAMQPELIDVLPQEALRERALQWLSTHDGWLLVLDNVTDPGDVEGLLARVGRRGRVVFTSRSTDGWYGIGRVLALPVLAAPEAVDLFTRVATHAGPRDTYGADVLCTALGQLPLAVEIAAAYCGRTATPPVAYLAELDAGGWPGNAEDAVARTLRVSLDRLAASDPYAGELLRLLAWFGPDRIPPLLLPPGPAARRALGELAAHSMVTLHEDGSVSVHRLVQAAARRPDPQDPHRAPGSVAAARAAAEEAIVAAVPGDPEVPARWETFRLLVPHVEAYLRHAAPESDGAGLLAKLVKVRTYLVLSGARGAAVGLLERALAAAERLYGTRHPATFTMRAGFLSESGSPEEAAALVRDMAEEVGADDEGTLLARRILVQVLKQAGRGGEAIAQYEELVADLTRVMGPDDRRTLGVLADLARAYMVEGRVPEAVDAGSRATAGLWSVLGAERLETLEARFFLAGIRMVAGDMDGAVADLRELLPVFVRVLGEDHPYTAAVVTGLAELTR